MYYVKEKKGDRIELGNCGMIAGAFSSTSGKADITLTTNGQILYYNSGRQALNKGADGTVLTLASGLPSWAAASAGVALGDNNTWTGTNIFNNFVSGTPTTLTISSAIVTATRTTHRLETEGSASSDTLATVRGEGYGRLLFFQTVSSDRDITLTDEEGGEGTLNMAGDFTLNNYLDSINFIGRFSDGLTWAEVSRSNNDV